MHGVDERIAALERAVASGDPDALRHLAHLRATLPRAPKPTSLREVQERIRKAARQLDPGGIARPVVVSRDGYLQAIGLAALLRTDIPETGVLGARIYYYRGKRAYETPERLGQDLAAVFIAGQLTQIRSSTPEETEVLWGHARYYG